MLAAAASCSASGSCATVLAEPPSISVTLASDESAASRPASASTPPRPAVTAGSCTASGSFVLAPTCSAEGWPSAVALCPDADGGLEPVPCVPVVACVATLLLEPDPAPPQPARSRARVAAQAAGSAAAERCVLEREAADTPGSFFERAKATLSGR